MAAAGHWRKNVIGVFERHANSCRPRLVIYFCSVDISFLERE